MQVLYTEREYKTRDGKVGEFRKYNQNLSSRKHGAVWEDDAREYNTVIGTNKCDRSAKSAKRMTGTYLLSQSL
jgi:hypothetical protein